MSSLLPLFVLSIITTLVQAIIIFRADTAVDS